MYAICPASVKTNYLHVMLLANGDQPSLPKRFIMNFLEIHDLFSMVCDPCVDILHVCNGNEYNRALIAANS
jgi:hypothetical protein